MTRRNPAHRLLAAGALGALVIGGIVPAAAQETETADTATLGSFSVVFRPEDATFFDAEAGVWRPLADPSAEAERGDNGCLRAEDGTADCLPAAATSVGLASGDVLYWNALQGTENLSLQRPAAPAGGNIAENEDSRVLHLDPADPARSRVGVPVNPSGFSTEDRRGAEERGLVPNPLDPATFILPTNPEGAPPNSNGLFCSDQLHLANGAIIAVGGTNYYSEPSLGDTLRTAGLDEFASDNPMVEDVGIIELEGIRDTRVYQPDAGEEGTWSSAGPMRYGRWYPSAVTLADGDVLVASGVTKLIKPLYTDDDIADSGDNVPYLERLDAGSGDGTEASGTWSVEEGENGAVSRTLPLYPRLHLLPNGNVYYDAGGQAFNPAGQSYAEAIWNIAATYDPSAKAWNELGVPGLQGPTSIVTADGDRSEPGFRGSTFSAMLPLKPNADGTYDEAAVLSAGGVLLPTPGSFLPTDTSRINQIRIGDDGSESLETIPTGPLARSRWYGSGTVLPTGQVALFSGADLDAVIAPGSESPIREVELFTPDYADDDATVVVGGEWEDVATQTRGRTYHNSAILLPDASVLIGGHAPIPNSYGFVQNSPDVPGVREFANNFRDASFEIYYPPYLHHGDRPTITETADSVDNGDVLRIKTRDDVESVVLVRNPAYTHLVDADQRSVELVFERVDRPANGIDEIRADVPGPEVVPPGPYMVFVNERIDGELVPSVSHQIFVDAEAPDFARDGAGGFGDAAVGAAIDPSAVQAKSSATLDADPAMAPSAGPLPREVSAPDPIDQTDPIDAGIVGNDAAARIAFAPSGSTDSVPVAPFGLSALAISLGIGLAVTARRRRPDVHMP